MNLAGGFVPEPFELGADELVQPPALEVGPPAFGRRRLALELADRVIPHRPAGGESVAVDECLHAHFDLPLYAIQRGSQRFPALREEAAQLSLARIDGAEAAGNDGDLVEKAFEDLLVSANLLLQPRRIAEPVGQLLL